MPYTSVNNGIGSTARRFKMSKASRNYTTQYFQNCHSSGDIRAYYYHQRYTGVGGGEVIRAVAEAYTTGAAAGATVNAIHATGRVAPSMSVSGALNAIRATLEIATISGTQGGTLAALQLDSNVAHDTTLGIATTSGTQGGTLAALQLDSNVAHDTTLGAETAFVRVTNSGAHTIDNLFNIEVAPATDTPTALVSTHADHVSTHLIKCRVNGADMWLLACNAHT
jgi:hypothetical protein